MHVHKPLEPRPGRSNPAARRSSLLPRLSGSDASNSWDVMTQGVSGTWDEAPRVPGALERRISGRGFFPVGTRFLGGRREGNRGKFQEFRGSGGKPHLQDHCSIFGEL